MLKRSGKRVPFDRDKLQRSIDVALRKRAVDPERIERLVSGITRQLESAGEPEVTSETIGELVMAGLKGLDDVAYVRFASVYKNFREARDFEELLGTLSDGMPVPAAAPEPEGDPEPEASGRRRAGVHERRRELHAPRPGVGPPRARHHLAEPVGRRRRGRARDRPDPRDGGHGAGRAPARGARGARRRRRAPPAARPSTSPWSPAPITAARHPAPTRSWPPGSPGWSAPWRIPTRGWRGAATTSCGGAASRSRPA